MKRTGNRHTPKCKTCGEYGVRNEKHDAYFCPDCGIWIEKACGDPDCEFCVDRPLIPTAEYNDLVAVLG